MIPIKIEGGEKKAWSILQELPPEDVQKRALVSFDGATKQYTVHSYGMEFVLSLQEQTITSNHPKSDILLGKLKDFCRLSLLWYLVSAKDIPQTGRLIKPLDVKGGQRFFSGTHILPLNEIAEKYGRDSNAFLQRGIELGAERDNHGDASLKLLPLPRVPVYIILWKEDEEFPARTDLLLDSSCDMQIDRSDIIWAVAMMSVLVMLED